MPNPLKKTPAPRLVLGFLAILIGAGALLGFAYGTIAAREQAQAIDRSIATLGAALVAAYDAPATREGHPTRAMAATLAEGKPLAALELFDQAGIVKFALDPARQGAAVQNDGLFLARARPSCAACHAGEKDPIGGVRLVATAELRGRSPTELAGWAALGSLFVGLLLLRYLSFRFFEPLSRLLHTASRAEEGDYFIRADVRGNDAVARLASIMNELLAKITDLRVERIDGDRTLEEVARELELKAALAEKSKELEDAYQALDARLRELTSLYDLGRELSAELDPAKLVDRLADLLTQSVGLKELAIYTRAKDELRLATRRGFDGELVETPNLTKTALEQAMGAKEAVYVPSIGKDRRPVPHRPGPLEGSLLVVPLVHRNAALGLLACSAPAEDAFGEARRRLLVAIGQQAALALANAELFQKTIELSLTDGLTGILNRRALEERLDLEWENAIRYKHPLSVAMIDIDRFKHYNDEFGHQLGDAVLKEVSRTLVQNLRRVDALGRYGGEEFLAVLPHTDRTEALRIGEKLRAAVESIHLAQGKITISVGVATHPGAGKNLLTLVSRGDEALLQAKRGGRNRVVEGTGE